MKRRTLAAGALGGVLFVYLVVPFAVLAAAVALLMARQAGGPLALFASGDVLGPLGVSLLTATVATVVLAVAGIPLGYALARGRGRWREPVDVLVQLPLAVPPLIAGMLLTYLFGPYAPIPISDTWLGIVAAQVFVAAPYLVVGARAAFEAVDPALEGVAATLGVPEAALLPRVALPAAWPQVRASLLLSFLRAFGEFGATLILAYFPHSLPVATYIAFSGEGLSGPTLPLAALATGMAALVLVAMRLVESRRGRRRAEVPEAVGGPPPAGAGHGAAAAPAVASGAPRRELFRFSGVQVRRGSFLLRLEGATAARRVAVLGPSGCGKSLTLRLLAGLEALEGGTLLVEGARWAAAGAAPVPPQARRVGYQPQDYGLFPHLTVRQQIGFGLGRLARAEREATVEAWLLRLGLEGLGERYPDELSGGQRQRVALGRALAPGPRLLLLDEPFSALDTHVRRSLGLGLRALQEETGVPSVLVTHDPAEAAELAEEVWVLVGGRVAQRGQPLHLRRRPATPEVARLFGAGTVVPLARRPDGALVSGALELPARLAPPAVSVAQGYLPQDALLALPRGSDVPPGCTGAPATVWQAAPAAGGWLLRLRVDGLDVPVAVAAGPRPKVAPRAGEPCVLALDPDDMHLFDDGAEAPSAPEVADLAGARG